jgi:hypothetical protein
MTIDPGAGQPAIPDNLVDLLRLGVACYEQQP